MKYQISSNNIELSESMENLAMQKFARIETRLKKVPEEEKHIRIVMNKAQGVEGKFEVKAELKFYKNEYFTDETEYSLETALIKVVDEFWRMMEKDKDRWEKWEKDIRDSKRYGDGMDVGMEDMDQKSET
jgi:ribosome-associated translation inhibitor RaiA